ncbi:Calcium channel YVC1 [Grifola frondosa]|uniref:Calcium channel YVC1 n=1 Tax=Grifola frondosa TaxID=5627 RepID=A0A1C7MHI2_GRIFR|nr:Calcium channel YVC1 [Grifola frondosa]
MTMLTTEEQTSILSVESLHPSPETTTSLVRRVRTLTLKLLPVEVPEDSISDPTSRVITPQVVNAYIAAAGDFLEALPYCLIRARKEFMWDADHNPADYGENYGRAIACEVLARRVIHLAPQDKISSMMATRFTHKEVDGDTSDKVSALEMAIDSHCTIFLSSSEAQAVVDDLWRGRLIQKHDQDHDLDFKPFREATHNGFWSHLDPSRLSVPRYQNIFRILVWLLFLFAYSQAVREPLDKLDPTHSGLDKWEVVIFTNYSHCLLMVAFALRVAGIASTGDQSTVLRVRSFQCLSFAAPLLWMKIIPIFDGYKFVGTMQICVGRMLKESGIFFGLLALLGIGFMQGLYALDAADGQTDHPNEIFNVLVQALLQCVYSAVSPNYDMFSSTPAGLVLFYLWNVATAIILLNVLISLFSSAYDDVVGDAAAEYLTYFAGKVVGMIRAPDEFFVSEKTYAKINRYVMLVVFFIPLSVIAIYEAELDPSKNKWVKDWLSHPDEGEEDIPQYQDPEVLGEDRDRGLQISKVPFSQLIAAFPDTCHSSEAVIVREIKALREQIEALTKIVAEQKAQ